MFDVVVAAAPETPFSARVTTALRDARLRVFPCEVAPGRPPPRTLRVDAAVACATSTRSLSSLAHDLRASLEGAPPVVGVTNGERSGPTSGLVEVLSDDVPAGALAARVLRAAALAERRRSKVVLSGDLGDVGVEGLIASLAARRRTCIVKVVAPSGRAEISLEAGKIVHARADGTRGDGARDVLETLGAWGDATFEVLVESEVEQVGPPRDRPTGRPAPAAEATEVALAAAVLNAVAAYARTWLGPDVAGGMLERTRKETRATSPGLDAFSVSLDGIVSVTSVTAARGALPDALARWTIALFDEAARVMPLRFRRDRIHDVLGGLTRLVDQVGWGAALLPSTGENPQ